MEIIVKQEEEKGWRETEHFSDILAAVSWTAIECLTKCELALIAQ